MLKAIPFLLFLAACGADAITGVESSALPLRDLVIQPTLTRSPCGSVSASVVFRQLDHLKVEAIPQWNRGDAWLKVTGENFDEEFFLGITDNGGIVSIGTVPAGGIYTSVLHVIYRGADCRFESTFGVWPED